MSVELHIQEINTFLKKFNIGTARSFSHIKKGLANVVVKVRTTKGNYILKIIVRNSGNRALYEINVLNLLQGLPVPQPIKSDNGKYIRKYNKQHSAFVYPYLEGREYKVFSKKKLIQIGDFLARFHVKTASFKSSTPRLRFYDVNTALYETMVCSIRKSKRSRVRKEFAYIQERFSRYIVPKDLPQGPIHTDCKPENTIFNKDILTGVLDFDNVYTGPQVFDLATTVMWFCCKNGEFKYTDARYIIDAYAKIRPLSQKEKGAFVLGIHNFVLTLSLIACYMCEEEDPKPYTVPGRPLPYAFVEATFDNLLAAEKKLQDDRILAFL